MNNAYRSMKKRIGLLLPLLLLGPSLFAQTDYRALFMNRSVRNESGNLFMSGEVRDDQGRPVSGARVIAVFEQRPDFRSETKTDEQGKWNLRFLKKGKWIVSAFFTEKMSEFQDVFLNANQRNIVLILTQPAVEFLIEAKAAIYREDPEEALRILAWFIQYFPNSRELGSALFWTSFTYDRMSRSRKDRDESLRLLTNALAPLNRLISDFPDNEWTDDAGILQIEIALRLYRMGRSRYAEIIEQGLSLQERSKIDVKLAALDALMSVDPPRALLLLEEIALHDPDPVARRKTVLILGRSGGEDAAGLLQRIARNDPEPAVRKAAAAWLALR